MQKLRTFQSKNELMEVEMELWSKTRIRLSKCQWNNKTEIQYLLDIQFQWWEAQRQSRRRTFSKCKSILIKVLRKWDLSTHLQLQIYLQEFIKDKTWVILENEPYQQKETQLKRVQQRFDITNILKLKTQMFNFTRIFCKRVLVNKESELDKQQRFHSMLGNEKTRQSNFNLGQTSTIRVEFENKFVHLRRKMNMIFRLIKLL